MCEYQDRSGKSQRRARTNETEDRCEYDRNEQRPEILRPYASNFLYNAAGEFRKEYGGPQQTDDGGVKYVLSDWQGSTRAIVGNTGHVQSRMDYSAFGESIGTGTGVRTAQQGFSVSDSLRQRYGLTERDEATGLDVTWFRKLENRGGRWTSPDPYNGSANIGNGQSWNRYSYVENQPTNYVDPSGLFMIGPRPPGPREQSWLEICWLLGICGNPTSQRGEEVTVGGSHASNSNNSSDCGVNPATGTPGINVHPVQNPRADRRPGGLGNLRPGNGGAGGFRERTGQKHDGNDIVAPIGSPIYANRDGTVTLARSVSGYGNTVIIDHWGTNTLYAHLSQILVSRGQVTEGQIIGYAGVSGNANSLRNSPDEQHVHMGVFFGAPTLPAGGSARWGDPTTYLNSQCPPAEAARRA